MTTAPRVTFEFTVDEAVELQREFLKSSSEAGSWRRRGQWQFAAAFTIAASAMFFIAARRQFSTLAIVVVIGALGALSLLLVIPYGLYYDDVMRRRTRRFLIEQYGGEGPHRCSIEIRPEGLWVAQSRVEMTFPWREATGVRESDQGISVAFKAGLVLVRSRGFGSDGERSEFLRHVQELIPARPVR